MNLTIQIYPIQRRDRSRVAEFVKKQWGDTLMVVHGEIFPVYKLSGFLAKVGGNIVGLITYVISEGGCEIISLDSSLEGMGIGTALLQAAAREAMKAGKQRLWLVTTNDNLHALGFYQRRGFKICAFRPGAVEAARIIKPSIPLVAENGIPIRDEIELELEPKRLVE